MLKKTIKYTDFNGVDQSEDFYFNLTKAELVEMDLTAKDNSLRKQLQEVIDSKSGKLIIATFKDIIAKSYGVRSDDGKRFMKSPALTAEFESTQAYSELFLELVTDAAAAVDFIRGLVPADIAALGAEETERVLAQQTESDSKTPSQVARELSESRLQGHKSKQESDIQTVPSLPTVPADEKFPTVPLVTTPAKDLSSMSIEELQEELRRRNDRDL